MTEKVINKLVVSLKEAFEDNYCINDCTIRDGYIQIANKNGAINRL